MLRLITFVLIFLGILLGGAYILDGLANEPGTVTLDYGGMIYEVTLLDAVMVLVVGILALLLALVAARFVIALVRFIAGDADAFGGFWVRQRERRGLDALSKSMVALAAGDARTAQKKAKLAEQRLMKPGLTRLLNAQAAVMAGDQAKAETYYKALMAEPETAFVGTQGLLTQAIEKNDTKRALKLAEHAQELNPKNQGTLDTLYTLQSRSFDWEGARKTLTLQRKQGHIEKHEANRRESALVLAQAEDAVELGEIEHARALSVEAAKLNPGNVNAVSTAVKMLLESGSTKAASKLVRDAWQVSPHPQLAAAYAAIDPDEAPAARRRRFETLFALQPEHPETRFLQAELALVAEDWRGARNAIQDLRETEPSARSCAIFAAIARGEGEPDHIVRGWLAKALGAPRNEASDSAIGHAAMLPILIGPEGMEPDVAAASDLTDGMPEEESDGTAEDLSKSRDKSEAAA